MKLASISFYIKTKPNKTYPNLFLEKNFYQKSRFLIWLKKEDLRENLQSNWKMTPTKQMVRYVLQGFRQYEFNGSQGTHQFRKNGSQAHLFLKESKNGSYFQILYKLMSILANKIISEPINWKT